ncbi:MULTISPECIES: aldo/keto reductase [unclassified Pseudoclavibacter]|uniref:aldo/keto reductase n=1 Tax=unclassified Pseudoclavibacter TaxID=2615177 RepID=UPI001BA4AC74|nr:aldo/keto reductase [Pseudoclavibacter sp. Marseille-Q4354]MBS3178210.1 aldo/keto reductase [Pseudoclavibacter sp. Marseille-Q4354]
MIERLGFGAASIGNLYREVSDEQARAALAAAWDEGVRVYDTAPHYGLGLSERRLGDFLTNLPAEEYTLSTKVGRLLVPNPDFTGGTDEADGFAVPDELVRRYDPSKSGVERSLSESLERMGVDVVDVAYLHDPDVYDLDAGISQGLPALVTLREQGVISEVGIGVNSVDAALRAVNESDIDVVMIAGRYTLLEQPAAAELLPRCLERGVRVVTAAVFNSGLLATATRSASAHYNYGAVPDAVAARVDRLAQVCGAYDVTLPQAAIQFPLRHPAVSTVVVGTSRAAAVRENAEHLRAPIPEELWQELAALELIPVPVIAR